MSVVVVLLLAALWAVILVPGLLRARRDSSPLHSVDYFERSMSVLAAQRSGSGRHILVPGAPRRATAGRAARRRLLVAAYLVAVVALTGVCAVRLGGWWWLSLASATAAATGYGALWAGLRQRRGQARRKLRHLPSREPAGVPPAPLRRAVGDAAEPSPPAGVPRG